jgi:hypothetical protein
MSVETRVTEALARVDFGALTPDVYGRLANLTQDWRTACAHNRQGPDSPQGRAVLLEMVRVLWARDDIWVRHLGMCGLQKWEACMGARGLALGITELLALVAALEVAPPCRGGS